VNTTLEDWLRAGPAGFGSCERVIETSISRVFLYADHVLKLKRPVDFGFVDFTTLEKRLWAAERELAFNQPAAPDIYRAVHRITQGPDGALALDGSGETIDVALEMRRFDSEAVLSLAQGPIDPYLGEAIGRVIARQHRAAPRLHAWADAEGLRYVGRSNAATLRGLGRADAEDLIAATEAEMGRLRPLFDRRMIQGWRRPCHGDLHLGNILVENGAPVLFDCIEFNDGLREIDVLYDLAFPLMDLWKRGDRAAANRALNGWLDAMARDPAEGLYEGLAALPFFQSVRAAVRAHVRGHEGDGAACDAYLAAARAHLRPVPPHLVAVGGLSGSGKTTLARALAPDLGRAPGAAVLRSDETRKRLFGREPLEPLPREAYAPEVSGPVYGELFRAAAEALAAGAAVILDAAFLRPAERDAAAAVANDAGVPFQGVWLEADPKVLKDRVAARASDASDATPRVVDKQLDADLGAIAWTRMASVEDGWVERALGRLRL
jgi:uncharacterized protein